MVNSRGDVVALFDSTGKELARYNYDAWGNCTVTTPTGAALTDATHIANINPLRYRGYYLDTDTGFYYLQSRYYDPVTHRFLNADTAISRAASIQGYNLFSYCLNNPLKLVDEGGDWPKWLTNIGNAVKNVVKQVVKVAKKVVNTVVSFAKSFSASASAGIGFGAKAKVGPVNISGVARTDYTSTTIGKGRVTSGIRDESSFSASIGSASIGYSKGKSHPYSSSNCTCCKSSFMQDVVLKGLNLTNCPSWKEDSGSVGFSASLFSKDAKLSLGGAVYLGIGGEASIDLDINYLVEECIKIWGEE